MDINYLTKCEELGIIPEFLNFKPPKLLVYDNVDRFYRKVLLEQLKIARTLYNIAENNRNEKLKVIRNKTSISQYHLLLSSIKEKSIKEKMLDKKQRHKKKLASLWNNQRKSKTPNCIINNSSHELTISESSALMFGLKHSILPKTIDEINIKASIKSQIKQITKNENKTLSYDVTEQIRTNTIKFISESKKVCSTRKNKAVHRTLKNLSQNERIKCLKMDKGNGVVLLNTTEYIKKMSVILDDTKKFKKLDFNLNGNNHSYEKAPWYKKEKSIYSYINKYIKPIVDEKVYFSLIPKGSQPGKMYGMAKHHKTDCPLRPVLSAIDTPEYGLCKWLEIQLKPLLKSKWIINSNIEFMDSLKTIKPKEGDVCRTFDIKSLYTCVPLEETINMVADDVYSNENLSVFTKSKITKKVFKNILKTCSQSIFCFNNQVFKQIDGLSMGSPLAPLLANWFVSKLETGLLNEIQPKMYNVDDIFTIFSNEEMANEFNQKLNTLHQDLVFTMESSTSNKLPFLDISVKLEENRFTTSSYKIPSNTEVLLNFHSCTPQSWKKNLIRQLLIRNKRLVSEELQNLETNRIKNLLLRNGYPINFINTKIEKLQKLENKPQIPKQQYLTVPYIKKVSEKFSRNITKNLETIGINIKVAFRTS